MPRPRLRGPGRRIGGSKSFYPADALPQFLAVCSIVSKKPTTRTRGLANVMEEGKNFRKNRFENCSEVKSTRSASSDPA
jgi:hypothetical protein